MFGISGPEFIVLVIIAAVVLGPERLPQYTQQLANLVRSMRRMAVGASEQVRTELGPEFDDIDWRKLDPRQYDPRRIVREALAEDFDPDDPLGMKSVTQDIRSGADDIRNSVNDTVNETRDAVKGRRPSAGTASTKPVSAPVSGSQPVAEAAQEPTAARWNPDTL